MFSSTRTIRQGLAMPLNILVLSAAVGAGHMRAAEAVELALQELAPHDVVQNVDVLTLTNGMFRKLYGSAYLDLVNKLPHVLGYFYDFLDRAPSPQKKSDRLRQLVQRLNLGAFLKFLHATPWDVVVNTHFLPAEMIAGLKVKGDFTAPQLTVTTDFETLACGPTNPANITSPPLKKAHAIWNTGAYPRDIARCRGSQFILVFRSSPHAPNAAGSMNWATIGRLSCNWPAALALGQFEKILDSLCRIEQPLQIVVVTGRNSELRDKLLAKALPERHRVKILGFTTEMDEWMTAADLIGHQTWRADTSEALACGAAIAVVNPIPGQESRNSDFLLEHGAAIKINNMATLELKIGDVLANSSRLTPFEPTPQHLENPTRHTT